MAIGRRGLAPARRTIPRRIGWGIQPGRGAADSPSSVNKESPVLQHESSKRIVTLAKKESAGVASSTGPRMRTWSLSMR